LERTSARSDRDRPDQAADPEPEEETEAHRSSEADCKLTELKTGTEHLILDEVRRIIRAAGVGVEDSLDAVDRIEEEIQLYTSDFPEADEKELRKQSEDTVLEYEGYGYEGAMLAWEQLREEGEVYDSGAESESEDGPTGEELLGVLDRILASEKAVEVPEEKQVESDWPQEVLCREEVQRNLPSWPQQVSHLCCRPSR
jgi:hypothetical protein